MFDIKLNQNYQFTKQNLISLSKTSFAFPQTSVNYKKQKIYIKQ